VSQTVTAAPPIGAVTTDRAVSERRLGWKLTAPAAALMVVVTAYPIDRKSVV
jgi:multiple sugar transport system permease protein